MSDTPTPLAPLAPYLADHWVAFSDDSQIGYEIHQAIVYPQGWLFGGSGVGQVLMSDLPAEMRPAAPISVVLSADPLRTIYPRTDLDPPGQKPRDYIPLTWHTTVNPDGTWVLDDALPPEMTSGVGDYSITLILGGSWRGGADNPPIAESLAPYLSPDFTDVDATIVRHRNRVHVAGRVKATVLGAGSDLAGPIASGLPEIYRPAQVPPQQTDTSLNDAATVIDGGNSALEIVGDSLRGSFPEYVGIDAPYYLSTDTAAPSGGPLPEPPPNDPGDVYLHGPVPRGLRRTHVPGGPGVFDWGNSWTQDPANSFPTCPRFGVSFPAAIINAAPPFTDPPPVDIAAMIAAFPGPPDWVMILAAAGNSATYGGASQGSQCDSIITPTGEIDAFTSLDTNAPASLALTVPGAVKRYRVRLDPTDAPGDFGPGAVPIPVAAGDGNGWRIGFPDHYECAIFAPPTPQYDFYPVLPAYGALLWRPDLAPAELIVDNGSPFSIGFTAALHVQVVPFYEERGGWLQPGSVVDLTSGWAAIETPSPPSIVTPGDPTGGNLGESQVLGSRG